MSEQGDCTYTDWKAHGQTEVRQALGGSTYKCDDLAELPRVSTTESVIHVGVYRKSAKNPYARSRCCVVSEQDAWTDTEWKAHRRTDARPALGTCLGSSYECNEPAELPRASTTESVIHVSGYRESVKNPYTGSRCYVVSEQDDWTDTERKAQGQTDSRTAPGISLGSTYECNEPAELPRVSKTESTIHVRWYLKSAKNPYAGSRCCVVSEQGDCTDTDWKAHGQTDARQALVVAPTSVTSRPSSHESPRPSR